MRYRRGVNTPMARRWIVRFVIFGAAMILLPAYSKAAPSLYETLTHDMDERYESWGELNGDRDVTDEVCPLVTVAHLDEMQRENAGDIKTGVAQPLLGVPSGSTFWLIRRGAPGWLDFRTITLMILTNQDYCRAAYYVHTF